MQSLASLLVANPTRLRARHSTGQDFLTLVSEHEQRHHPADDGQAREVGRVAADLGPPGAAPDADQEHQVPGNVGDEREHDHPGGRTGDDQRQGEHGGEQVDETAAEDAPEPEGAAERKAAAPELDDSPHASSSLTLGAPPGPGPAAAPRLAYNNPLHGSPIA